MRFDRTKRHCLLMAGVLLAGSLLMGCTSTSSALYRGSGEPGCSGVFTTDEDGIETTDGKGYSCMIATYRLPEAGNEGWLTENEKRYKLAFLEFDEKSLGLKHQPGKASAQSQALLAALQSDKQKYVITFVHGWRHEASLQDNDVRRFRVLLAYARSFLNWRCQEKRRYCDTEIVGVYIGWRGKSVHESANETIGTALAAPTFWARKRQSEKHAPFVIEQIDEIQAQLNLDPGNPDADKMMIIGHSFGGNLLATGLKTRAVNSVIAHKTGAEMAPLLGDLTVLINPASEAHNWIDIQKAMREKVAGFGGDIAAIDQTSAWEKEYPQRQRPIYVSLTATDNWAVSETKGKKVIYDWATGVAFPAGQLAALRVAEDRRHAIGHVLPRKDYHFGATHEIVTNDGSEKKTSYAQSATRTDTQCVSMDGWLSATRQRSPSGWDSHYTAHGRNKLTFVSRTPRVDYQIRQVLWPEHSRGNKSYEPANSPFWNMRAYSNVVANHGGYVNYPMWCALNQMVLDDVTSKPVSQ